MATIKTLLDHPRENGELKKTEVSLFFRISFGRKASPIDIPGELKVRPTDWDFDLQKIRPQVSGSVRINHKISQKLNHVYELYLKYEHLSPAKMKRAIKEHKEEEDQGQQQLDMTFNQMYDLYYASKENELDWKSLKKFRRIPSMLKKYMAHRGKSYDRLIPDDMTIAFFDDFKSYLHAVPPGRNGVKGVLNQTVKRYIVDLQDMLRWGLKRDYHNNKKFDQAENVKVPKEYPNPVLTIEEIAQLEGVQILDLKLRNIRDAFVTGCYTGQRFEDIIGINEKDFIGNTWHLWQSKGESCLLYTSPSPRD